MTRPSSSSPPHRGDPPEPPDDSYRVALRECPAVVLREVLDALAVEEAPRSGAPASLAATIRQHLERPGAIAKAIAETAPGARAALSLMALRECQSLPAAGLFHALACLGYPPIESAHALIRHGLAVPLGETWQMSWESDNPGWERIDFVAHPAAVEASATAIVPAPELSVPPADSAVREREADGWEPILRVAAAWQRLREAPLRRTQSGTLYKRDRERIEDDPALAGAIADAIEPLPSSPLFWLDLARASRIALDEPGTDRIVAAPAADWSEHAVHLPQLLAIAWLNADRWHDRLGAQDEANNVRLALPYARPAILLALASLPLDGWAALDDLKLALARVNPDWSRLVLDVEPAPPAEDAPAEPRGRSKKGKAPAAAKPKEDQAATLRSVLLGAAYQLNLVRAAEEERSGRELVRLSALGRYVLGLGPPPPPRPSFEQFLLVQPNFEVIAYRQGLSPHAVADLVRFARWSKIGGALELKLTPESVYHGLEDGMSPEAMLDRLGRHSARALAPAVAEAIRSWSIRREKVTYHAAATLLECATPEDADAVLLAWPAESPAPERISPRLLLVPDPSAIPFQKFRLNGARDYRSAREPCVGIEPDGIHLKLDLARSDLMVDAELGRFAEPLGADGFTRRYRLTPATLARADAEGMTPARLARWFQDRTGEEMPPAIRLMFRGDDAQPDWAARKELILTLPDPVLIDGLIQHPLTAPYLGERLGPGAVIVRERGFQSLRAVLAQLGITLRDGDSPVS